MTAPDPWASFLAVPQPRPGPYVAALRLPDTALPDAPDDTPLWVVLTGGAGQLAGPVALCERRGLPLAAVEVALQDPVDPAANARRVLTAADAAPLPDGVALHVAVAGTPTPAWLAALDEVAMHPDGAVSLPLDDPDPGALERWVDAALDRELPFSLRGGSAPRAIEALTTTARLWGDPDDLLAARRWCRTWACDDAEAAVAYLEGLS